MQWNVTHRGKSRSNCPVVNAKSERILSNQMHLLWNLYFSFLVFLVCGKISIDSSLFEACSFYKCSFGFEQTSRNFTYVLLLQTIEFLWNLFVCECSWASGSQLGSKKVLDINILLTPCWHERSKFWSALKHVFGDNITDSFVAQ